MSKSTLPRIESSGTDEVLSDDQDDEIACACELGASGCFEHYQGAPGLKETEDE